MQIAECVTGTACLNLSGYNYRHNNNKCSKSGVPECFKVINMGIVVIIRTFDTVTSGTVL